MYIELLHQFISRILFYWLSVMCWSNIELVYIQSQWVNDLCLHSITVSEWVTYVYIQSQWVSDLCLHSITVSEWPMFTFNHSEWVTYVYIQSQWVSDLCLHSITVSEWLMFTFNHREWVTYVYIILSILRVNHTSYCCMSCILGWRPFITIILNKSWKSWNLWCAMSITLS